MSQNNSPNLAGWAAIITAIATLLGTFGISQFFPQLMIKILKIGNNPTYTQSVKLSSKTIEKLENHISSQGKSLTESNKAIVLEEALEDYVNSQEQNSSTSSNQSVPPTSTTDLNLVEIENGYRFNLQNCVRISSTNVSCNFLITNLDYSDDPELIISNDTRVFSSSGNDYYPRKYYLGSQKRISIESTVRNKLLQNIPMKSSFTFEVPKEVNEFTALELKYLYSEWSKIKFHNIKISSNY